MKGGIPSKSSGFLHPRKPSRQPRSQVDSNRPPGPYLAEHQMRKALAAAPSTQLRVGVVGPARYCSPRHRMSFNSGNGSSKYVGRRARHVIGCRSTQETGVYNTSATCSPHHRMQFNSGNGGSNHVGQRARHVIGCHFTWETGVLNASGDLASRYCLPRRRMPFTSGNGDSKCVG